MLTALLDSTRSYWAHLRHKSFSEHISDGHDFCRTPAMTLAICAAWFSAIPVVRRNHLHDCRLSTYVTAVAASDAVVARLLREHRLVLVDAVQEKLLLEGEEFVDIDEEEDVEDEAEEQGAAAAAAAAPSSKKNNIKKPRSVSTKSAAASSTSSSAAEDPESKHDDEVVALVMELPLSTFGTLKRMEDGGEAQEEEEVEVEEEESGRDARLPCSARLAVHFSKLCADDFQDDVPGDFDDGSSMSGNSGEFRHLGVYNGINFADTDDKMQKKSNAAQKQLEREEMLIDLDVPFSILVCSPSDAKQQSLMFETSRACSSPASAAADAATVDRTVTALSASMEASTQRHTLLLRFGFLRSLDLNECARLASFLNQHLRSMSSSTSGSSSAAGPTTVERQTLESICRDWMRICFAVLVVKHRSLEFIDSERQELTRTTSVSGAADITKAEEELASLRQRQYAFGRELSLFLGKTAADYLGGGADDSRSLYSTKMCFQDTICMFSEQQQQQQQQQQQNLRMNILSFAHMCHDTATKSYSQSQLRRALVASASATPATLFRVSSRSAISQLFSRVGSSAAELVEGVVTDCVPLAGQWPLLQQAMRWMPPSVLLSSVSIQIGLGLIGSLGASKDEANKTVVRLHSSSSSSSAPPVSAEGDGMPPAALQQQKQQQQQHRPFPPLLESLSRLVLNLQSVVFLSRQILAAVTLSGDRSVSTKLYLSAATADMGARGLSPVFDKATAALAVVPRLVESVSWAVFEPSTSLGTMLLVWRHPGLIALQLAIQRTASLLGERLEVADSVSTMYGWAHNRVRAKRRRRVRGALRKAALEAFRQQRQGGETDCSKMTMACLDPFFCEPLVVPTRGDDPRLDVSGAFGGDDGGEDGSSSGENESDGDDDGAPTLGKFGRQDVRSSSSSSVITSSIGNDSCSSSGASFPSSADNSISRGGRNSSDLDEIAEVDEAEALAGAPVNPDEEPDEDDDDLHGWNFPQIELGVILHDTNPKQERALRSPTLGLALLACAALERRNEQQQQQKTTLVDDDDGEERAAVTAPAASVGALSKGRDGGGGGGGGKKKKRANKKSKQHAVIPRHSGETSFFISAADLRSGVGGSVFCPIRWPATPLHINEVLSPFIEQLQPSYFPIHRAAAEAIKAHLAEIQQQEQQKKQQTQEQEQSEVEAPSSYARFVIGRRYTIAPVASTVATLFTSTHFRAMRSAGFEVETVVAASAAILSRTTAQLDQSSQFNGTCGSQLNYYVVDGVSSSAIELAGTGIKKYLSPHHQELQQQEQQHEHVIGEGKSDGDDDVDGETLLLDDPRVALEVLQGRIESKSMRRTAVEGRFVGDEDEYQLTAATQTAQMTTSRAITGILCDNDLSADMLDNPVPLASGRQNEDEVCMWIEKQTKSQHTIDVNRQVAANSSSSWVWEFCNVSFAYPSDPDRPVLHHISFKLPAHSFVGIVGLSGSGKTTLLALMLRIYEPTKGEIRLGGRPLSEYPPRWLRRHLAYVGPLCSLLEPENGTAGSEVAAASPLATAAAIRQSLEDAWVPSKMYQPQQQQQHQHHHHLPTISTMSGGEAQRVQIARAFAKMNAPPAGDGSASSSTTISSSDVIALLFDEGTSSLDSQTEAHIVDRINRKSEVRHTRICVAHRIFTVRDCDVLLIVYRGRLVAQGTFVQCVRAAQRVVSAAAGGAAAASSSSGSISATTKRGLRWFLRSVEAQALKDDAGNLEALFSAGEEEMQDAILQDDARSSLSADDASSVENSDIDEDASAAAWAEEDGACGDEDAQQGETSHVDAIESLLETLRSLPPEQRHLFATAVKKQLGHDAFGAWERLQESIN